MAVARLGAAHGQADGVVERAAEAAEQRRLALDGVGERALGARLLGGRGGGAEGLEGRAGAGAAELLAQPALGQAVEALGEQGAVVGDDHGTYARGHVVNGAQVARLGGELADGGHEPAAKLAGACLGKALEVPGDVDAGGAQHGVELLVQGAEKARVEGG